MIKSSEQVESAYELGDKSREALYIYWREHVLFTWKWWIAVVLLFLIWIVWIYFHKRNSTDRLLYAGCIVVIISSWLDFLGVHFNLWYYTVYILPTPPSFILWDFCLMPVLAMVIIQIKPSVNPIFKALLFAGMAAFIGEPLFDVFGFYVRKHWEYYYSFPIDILIYWIAHVISRHKNFDELV